MLAAPLDLILNTTSKVRIMRLLCEQDRLFTARELSRLTQLSLPAILNAISDLEAQGALLKEVSGAQFLCRANREHILIGSALQPLFRAEAQFSAAIFDGIRSVLKKPHPVAAWIFGSVARGQEQKGSDLDLFVLTSGDDASATLEAKLLSQLPVWKRHFGYTVAPMIMSAERAGAQLRAGNAMLRNAVEDARLVIGEIPQALRDAAGTTHDAKNKKPTRR